MAQATPTADNIITYSNEIRDLLALAHSIARLKKQMLTYDNQMYHSMCDRNFTLNPVAKKPFIHTDAQLRAKRRAVEQKITALFKPLKYPIRDGWVKYVETCTDGHAILQANITGFIDTMRDIENGYWSIIKPHKELRSLRRDAIEAHYAYSKLADRLHDARRRASSAMSILTPY